jgi:phenylpyruvate tautomerase PptA (4-oxalocrotonate tautomerase family)
MPLIRISMRRGRPASEPAAIVDGIYKALRETFEVPQDDLFAVIHQHDAEEFVYNANYFGFARSDAMVIIQITVSSSRGVTQKKALFAAIAENLRREPGLRSDDIFINLIETTRENWSFGAGVAQYA